jgi:DNA-binding beta-propeller fold protein YncE
MISLTDLSLRFNIFNDGNVYVAGRDSINVMVISPDGHRHRQLLSSKDGLVLPKVLDYERSTNMLLVVNQHAVSLRMLLRI